MIKYKICSPQESSRKGDYERKIWRIYFEDPHSEETDASAFISEQDLRYKNKINSEDKEAIRKYLTDWAKDFLKEKSLKQLRGEHNISNLENLEN